MNVVVWCRAYREAVVVVVVESGVESGSGEMDEYGSREQDVK